MKQDINRRHFLKLLGGGAVATAAVMTGCKSKTESKAVEEYKKQVEFDDKIEIRISVAKYNGAVLDLEYEFYNVTKEEICTKATSSHCFIHGDRIVSLKKELPKLDMDLREQLD